jgi:hypothetical protein
MTEAPEKMWVFPKDDWFIAGASNVPIVAAGANNVEYTRSDILADWQASQGYRYIGKDGKPVLARDLEDERDTLRAEVERLRLVLHLARAALEYKD